MVRPPWLAVAILAVLPAMLRAGTTFPNHIGKSYDFVAVGAPTDTHPVSDREDPLDEYLYRNDGPITATVRIRRYVAPTDAAGHLLDVPTLVERGIVTPTFKLRLPVFDVDRLTHTVLDCDGDDILDEVLNERDELYFNDHFVAALAGRAELWMGMEYELPIELLRFPTAPGQEGYNTIRVDIDVLNENIELSSGAIGCEVWATEVDWVAIEFGAAPPIVLVHGIRSDASKLADLERALESEGYLVETVNLPDMQLIGDPPEGWETCADIPYNNSVMMNLDTLRADIPPIAEMYGSSRVHLIGHSKGGLDARVFASTLASLPIPVKVADMQDGPVIMDLMPASLVSLNTPYAGSALADLGIAGRVVLAEETKAQGSFGGYAFLAGLFDGPYYCDLTQVRAQAWTDATPLPYGTQVAAIATDADIDDDGELSEAESIGFVEDSPSLSRFAANFMYTMVGYLDGVTVTVVEVPDGPDSISVDAIVSDELMPNDAVVTVESASRYPLIPGIDGWHHLNVYSEENGRAIAREAQSPGGVLDWRVR